MSIDIFKDFATDTKAEEAGIWVPYAGDVEFLIARTGNKKYSRVFLKEYNAAKRILDAKGPTAEAKAEELNVSTLAQAILLGWKGDLKFQGEALEYSVANAKRLLAVKDFARWVVTQAEDMSMFKLEKDEADVEK